MGASTETVPSRSVTAEVLSQTKPQPRTITFLPTLGEPWRSFTTTRSHPLSKTSRRRGVHSSNGIKSSIGDQSSTVKLRLDREPEWIPPIPGFRNIIRKPLASIKDLG